MRAYAFTPPLTQRVNISKFTTTEKIQEATFSREHHAIRAYYANLIPKLRDLIEEKRRGKLPKGILLHQNNASNHKSATATAPIAQAVLELVRHPPYSSDFAPSDCRLFRKFKEHLHGKQFLSHVR
ncbi:hypothetical protein Trydic_g11059 [Trypoxylus dichotomus]